MLLPEISFGGKKMNDLLFSGSILTHAKNKTQIQIADLQPVRKHVPRPACTYLL